MPRGIKLRISPTISVTKIIAVNGAFEIAPKYPLIPKMMKRGNWFWEIKPMFWRKVPTMAPKSEPNASMGRKMPPGKPLP